MKKVAGFLIVLLLLLGLVAGCGSNETKNEASSKEATTTESASGGQKDEPVELVFWHGIESQENNQALTEAIEKFNESHPDIKVKAQSYGAQDQAIGKIQTALAGKNAPDLVWLAPAYTGQFAKAGVLAAAEDFINNDPGFNPDDIYKGLWDVSSYNGKKYTIPFEANNLAIFYNKKAFAEAGITEIPETWNQFLEAAKKLTVDKDGDGKIDQYGFQIPIGTNEWTVWTWQTYLWQAGGEFLTENNSTPAFNSKAGVDALQFWVDLVYKEKVANFSETDAGYKTDDFESGKIAMQIIGPWTLPQLKANKNVDFGVFFMPKKERFATNIGGENLFIFKSTPEREKAAWEFAKFIMSADFQVDWSIKTGYLPVSKSAVESGKYQEFLKKNEVVKVFVDQMEYGFARPSIPAYNAISVALGKEIEKALYQEKSAKESLDAAAKAAEKELKK
ncbi:ABC transporter substrate-binding protein [Microaerobacter geothermalis]|uniref:ABC transporter substrate-binding protein n=1 Tax=Microaerobacter geothermalis TaxID=674972 RepID=UPI001F445125|nr:ABC transporter substrate-binding protein [Microaerobacter geothermalis]MCF6094249.1 ABC transporter substrate-binding protein [Microaerobacter geothermalis]